MQDLGCPKPITVSLCVKAPGPDLWNSDFLMGYYVRIRVIRESQQGPGVGQADEDHKETAWQYHHINNLELVRGGLQAGLQYTCNVQAYNFLGGGPWSVGASTYLEIGTLGSTALLLYLLPALRCCHVTWWQCIPCRCCVRWCAACS